MDALDYVRQALFLTHRRRGRPPGWRIGRLVGYAELRRDAPNDGACYVFARRVFYLIDGDRDAEAGGVYSRQNAPMEAVDPRTVRPGEPGELTARAWGGTLADPEPLFEHEPSVVPAPHPGPLPVPWWFERRLKLKAQRRTTPRPQGGQGVGAERRAGTLARSPPPISRTCFRHQITSANQREHGAHDSTTTETQRCHHLGD